jgi:hypothetical protein
MTDTLGKAAVKVIIAFILFAMLITLASMLFMHEKRIDKSSNATQVVVASDGGPMPTCGGPMAKCGPDDDILGKIINILIG